MTGINKKNVNKVVNRNILLTTIRISTETEVVAVSETPQLFNLVTVRREKSLLKKLRFLKIPP